MCVGCVEVADLALGSVQQPDAGREQLWLTQHTRTRQRHLLQRSRGGRSCEMIQFRAGLVADDKTMMTGRRSL